MLISRVCMVAPFDACPVFDLRPPIGTYSYNVCKSTGLNSTLAAWKSAGGVEKPAGGSSPSASGGVVADAGEVAYTSGGGGGAGGGDGGGSSAAAVETRAHAERADTDLEYYRRLAALPECVALKQRIIKALQAAPRKRMSVTTLECMRAVHDGTLDATAVRANLQALESACKEELSFTDSDLDKATVHYIGRGVSVEGTGAFDPTPTSAQPMASTVGGDPAFFVGEVVEGEYMGVSWCRGTVEAVRENGTYDLQYDEFGRKEGVRGCVMRRPDDEPELCKGDVVEATPEWAEGEYFPGTVDAVLGGGTYTVSYDDGDTEQNVPRCAIRRRTRGHGDLAGKRVGRSYPHTKTQQTQHAQQTSAIAVASPVASDIDSESTGGVFDSCNIM
jgi:hypothetical protein